MNTTRCFYTRNHMLRLQYVPNVLYIFSYIVRLVNKLQSLKGTLSLHHFKLLYRLFEAKIKSLSEI